MSPKATDRPSGERVELYKGNDDEGWAWRYIAQNGRIISRSTEGYEHRQHALDQAVERNEGVPVFAPAKDTDQSSEAPRWVKVAG